MSHHNIDHFILIDKYVLVSKGIYSLGRNRSPLFVLKRYIENYVCFVCEFITTNLILEKSWWCI